MFVRRIAMTMISGQWTAMSCAICHATVKVQKGRHRSGRPEPGPTDTERTPGKTLTLRIRRTLQLADASLDRAAA